VDTLSARVYNFTKDSSSYLRGMKCALAALGLCRNVLAEPYEPFQGSDAAAIERGVREVQDLVEQLEAPLLPVSTD
jgi:hypothetical protein